MCDYDFDKFDKWKILVGDVPELTDPAKGVDAGGASATGYPVSSSECADHKPGQSSPLSLERRPCPSSFLVYRIIEALPLVGLQYHECEVQITLNPINQLYTYLDISGYRVAPGYWIDQDLEIQEDLTTVRQFRTQRSDPNFLRSGATVPPLNTWFRF
jgi:hypothetical protein